MCVDVQGASLRGRHTPPAMLAQEAKIVWSGQREGPCLTVYKCKLATRKCQEPLRHALGKQPTDATRMSIYRVCMCMYLVSCICDVYMYVCLDACDYAELSLSLA